jgi:inositol-phosphate phosphatase/L-galactose 1-phosphate phosphatase
LGIETKSKKEDICTKVDILNEEIVTTAIRKNFPSHKIIGEESIGTGTIPALTNEKTWIIDPIDGTTNFTFGLPMACVSIGFCKDKRPVAGVVYAPMTDELYVAAKGYGAFRNGVRLTKRKSTTISDAVVVFEFGYCRSKEAVSKMVAVVQRIMERGCLATRQIGSGVLDLCYVATGRISVVYAGVAQEGWKPWDYAAGMVIAAEAGCVIEAINQRPGEDFDIYSDSLICAVSQPLLEECRTIINS